VKLDVAAAIIIYENRILCMQRKESNYSYISKKFEFPGGKVEKNESFENALTRELKEEMDIDVKVTKDNYFASISHNYPDFSLTMQAYIIHVKSSKFVMKEHLSYKWLEKADLLTLDWVAADLPIVKKVVEEVI